MERFLVAFVLPKLNQGSIRHLHKPIVSNKIKTIIKSLPKKKSPVHDGFSAEFYQIFKEELISILLKIFMKLQVNECCQTYSMRPVLYSYQN
jgi:hypothetical protein